MEILLTLKIGFLMVLLLPYLSEGQSVTLNMPSYNTLNSRNMRITCEFQTDDQFTSIHLLNGNKDVVVSYVVKESQFKMAPESNIRLEIESGTSIEKGSLTFVFSQLSCPDFTWYVCRGGGMSNGISVDSTNTTLQISPGIDSLMKTSLSDLVVNQISSFVCRGTVRKEGPFSLQWYRRTLTSFSQLQVDPARVIDQNECSRSISSSLNYNVSETDGPNLVLWCRIESGQRVDKMVNFTVQEMSTIATPFTQQPVKGATVTLKMPSYATLNSVNMRITCEFANDDQLAMITLLSGNKATEATYVVSCDKFEISSDTFVSLEANYDASAQRRSLTFVLSQVKCDDFTWYVCRGIIAKNGLPVDSKNITLQALPAIANLMKTSIELVPNQISTFTCTGTIQKESPFSVKWYRKSLTSFSQLQDDQAKIIGQNECNRSIISLLNYNVSKTDGPNLVLSCQIQSGKNIVHKMKKFAVQGSLQHDAGEGD